MAVMIGTDQMRDQALAGYQEALDTVEEQTALAKRYLRELNHARAFLSRSPAVTPIGVNSRTIAAESYSEAAVRATRVVGRLVERVTDLAVAADRLASTVRHDPHPNQVGAEHAALLVLDGIAVGQ